MSFRTAFAAAAMSLAGVAPAAADEIEVEPGVWTYRVSALMGGVPMGQSGTECVSEREAKRSLSRTASALDKDCAISSASPVEHGWRFVMACTGRFAGALDGVVTASGDVARLNASGWVGQGQGRVPVSISGEARRDGPVCP